MHSTRFKYILLITAFVFYAVSAWAKSPRHDGLFISCDTLIIDGDTIFIERDENALVSDSTEPAKEVLPIIRQRQNIWSLGGGVGLNNTRSSFQTLSSEFKTLSDFVGRNRPMQINLLGFAEVAVRFASLKSIGGIIEMALVSGAGINQIKSQYTSLEDEAQLATDSLLSFGSDANELYYEYFTITEPPNIGEVDTFFVDLVNQKMSYRTWDVPLNLRVSINALSRPIRYYIESGVVRRFITSSQIPASHYLINAKGMWQAFSPPEFVPRRLLVPHFALGVERKLPIVGGRDQQFFTLGVQVSTSLSAISINKGSLLVLDVTTFSIAFFGRFFF